MKSVLQYMIIDKVANTAVSMLTCNEPKFIPNVGDTTVGPDGHVYVVTQRAFTFEKSEIIGGDQAQLIRCAIVPIEIFNEQPDDTKGLKS